jgi:renalase
VGLKKIAVIGAGISGLACARELQKSGAHSVTVFDKGRGVGGRVATRRFAGGAGADHGAQFFTVREEVFQKEVDAWVLAGAAAPWEAAFAAWDKTFHPIASDLSFYVGTPAMTSVAKHLATSLNVRVGAKVESLSREDAHWRLGFEKGETELFDTVLSSAPPEQTAALFPPCSFSESLRKPKIAPCWAVMVCYGTRLPMDWDAVFAPNYSISWMARNSSKPGRDASSEVWVLHGSPLWSEANLEQSPEWVSSELLKAFENLTGGQFPVPTEVAAHRWRYSLPTEPLAETALWDSALSLGACGDWCGGPKIEGAFLSGLSLAKKLWT